MRPRYMPNAVRLAARTAGLTGSLSAALMLMTLTGCGSNNSGNESSATRSAALSGATADAVAADADGYLRVPGGKVHKSCFHTVPNGSRIAADGTVSVNGKTVDNMGPCAFPNKLNGPTPTINGWEEWSGASTVANPRGDGNYFSGLQDSFTVPALPAGGCTSQTVYFFPAFENNPVSAINQPVLQCGPSSNGSTTTWAVSSWYIGRNGTASSPPTLVSPGDTINGTISCFNCAGDGTGCVCDIVTLDQRTSQGSFLESFTFEAWTLGFEGVLEAYSLNSCNQYPNGASGSIAFSNTKIYEGASQTLVSPNWGPNSNGGTPSCNYSVNNFNGGTTLDF